MKTRLVLAAGALFALLVAGPPALPCSLCGRPHPRPTLRQDAASAKLVLYGKMTNAKLDAASDTGGTTDLQIEKVLKSDPWLGAKKVVELPRYVRLDPKNDKYLIICDIFKGKLDPYRGEIVGSSDAVQYVEKVLKLDPKDRTNILMFYFDYLDHGDRTIATDAYLEFASATDAEIGQIAGKLPAAKLRKWLQDPQTASDRLGLYAFLLGACGEDKDAALLRSMIEKTNARTSAALSGLLSGYIRLQPREGWDLARNMLSDLHRPFNERYAIVSTLRFYHGWKPQESKEEVLRCLEVLLPQGEMADMAIEDLRRWEVWSLTDLVLAQFGKKTHDAPIIRRSIVRYALSCPREEAKKFATELRKQNPELVGDVEESLKFDKEK